MPPAQHTLVQDIENTLEDARGLAIGLQHEALAASHSRIDKMVGMLVEMPAQPEHRPSFERVRQALLRHRQLLNSLHDTALAVLRQASSRPPTSYGHCANLQTTQARPLLTTCA